MGIFFGIYILIIIIDYRNLINRKDKKQIVVYSVITFFTLCLAIVYFLNPYSPSLVELLVKIFNIKV